MKGIIALFLLASSSAYAVNEKGTTTKEDKVAPVPACVKDNTCKAPKTEEAKKDKTKTSKDGNNTR